MHVAKRCELFSIAIVRFSTVELILKSVHSWVIASLDRGVPDPTLRAIPLEGYSV